LRGPAIVIRESWHEGARCLLHTISEES
jgi:hypothetical protein